MSVDIHECTWTCVFNLNHIEIKVYKIKLVCQCMWKTINMCAQLHLEIKEIQNANLCPFIYMWKATDFTHNVIYTKKWCVLYVKNMKKCGQLYKEIKVYQGVMCSVCAGLHAKKEHWACMYNTISFVCPASRLKTRVRLHNKVLC